MALTAKQKQKLDIVSAKTNKTETDIKNIDYASKNLGYSSPVGSLAGTLNNKAENTEIPDVSSPTTQATTMRNVMDKITRSAYDKQASSIPDLLNKFKSQVGGTGVVSPDIAGGVIGEETKRLTGNVEDIYRNTLRTINTLETLKNERQKNVNDLMGSLAQSGMLSQLTGDEFTQIMQTGVLPIETLQKINASNTPEKKQILELASKYPDAGILLSDTLQTASAKIKNSRIYQEQVRPPVSAGGGTSEEEKQIQAFQKDASEIIPKLDAGDMTWASAFDSLKVKYPQASNDTINAILGGGIPYDEKTGTFNTKGAYGRAKTK